MAPLFSSRFRRVDRAAVLLRRSDDAVGRILTPIKSPPATAERARRALPTHLLYGVTGCSTPYVPLSFWSFLRQLALPR